MSLVTCRFSWHFVATRTSGRKSRFSAELKAREIASRASSLGGPGARASSHTLSNDNNSHSKYTWNDASISHTFFFNSVAQ